MDIIAWGRPNRSTQFKAIVLVIQNSTVLTKMATNFAFKIHQVSLISLS